MFMAEENHRWWTQGLGLDRPRYWEFVLNLVTEDLVEQMDWASIPVQPSHSQAPNHVGSWRTKSSTSAQADTRWTTGSTATR